MEVSHLWCHPQSLAILLMPQVLGSSLDRGERIEDTEQQNRPLAYSVLGLWETSRGQQHLEPPGTNRPGVCDTRSLGLDPGCLPFGGCSYTARTLQEAEAQGVLPFEDNCFPLGRAANHLGSLCLFGQACLLELGFWPSLGYLMQGSEPQLLHL